MSGTASSNTHDVMISYSWRDKETVYKIRDTLKQNGITYWIDVEKMSGSTTEAMSAAVENCTIFLMCYSKNYFQSKNCQKEADYADKKKKIIVPCKLEKDYDPIGWLGFILGSKLFFDFSGKYPFELQKKGLLREIKLHLQKVRDDSLAKKVDTSLKMEDDPTENSKGTGTKNEIPYIEEREKEMRGSIIEGTGSSNNSPSVMISYNLSNQKSVIKILDNLRKKGIPCWIDIDNMDGGSIQKATNTAIEKCTIFLLCFSAKYSECKKCLIDAGYAYQLRKTIIPCKMQEDEFDLSSDECLRSIIDSDICDFSGRNPFEEVMKKLLFIIESYLQKSD